MTHAELRRDLIAITTATILVIGCVMLAGPIITGGLLIVVVPVLIVVVLTSRAVARVLNATDDYCSKVDQELDARRQLRVQRTVHAEPQAQVIDLFTKTPIA